MFGALRLAALVPLLVLLAPASSLADARVDEAVARMDAADFRGAVELLDAAEEGTGLSRADLVRLYATRAAAEVALGDEAAMERDIRRLAVLEPDYAFPRQARPELQRALEAARAAGARAPGVQVQASRTAGGVLLTAVPRGDDAGLVREVRIHARRAGAGSWSHGTARLVLPVPEGAVEYFAEAIGPGGAVVASIGSADRPQQYDGGASSSPEGPLDGDDEGGGGLVIALYIGAGVLVVAIVVTLLVVTSGNDATQPGAPRIYE